MQIEPILHNSETATDGAASGPTLTIRDVSALLDVPAPTIRSWERRKALPTINRDANGHRRYTAADVEVLRRMRDHRANGTPVSRAAATASTPPPLGLCQRLLAAVDQLDTDAISVALDASLDAHGLALTIDEVLLPTMREVGERWSRGLCDISQEHLATTTVLAWLARCATPAPLPHQRPVVLSGGPLDRHTISLEAFAVLLRRRRLDCRNLGGQTPAISLRRAVEQCSAQAVVLVSQLARNRPAAVAALRELDSTGAALFYAGAAFRTTASRQRLPGYYLGGNLTHAADHIASQLNPA